MKNFDKTVPFDPGYSKISFSFANEISYIMGSYTQLKAPHQKKFQLMKLEPAILDLINKSTAFHLGCMFWGGFIHSRFKDAPKVIQRDGNVDSDEREQVEQECAAESKLILDFINHFDRDCKYFLNKPAKISSFIPEVLNSYIEFAEINKNFAKVKTTADVKLPKALSHFDKLTNEQLDSLCEKIYSAIEVGRIDNLLELGFYKL